MPTISISLTTAGKRLIRIEPIAERSSLKKITGVPAWAITSPETPGTTISAASNGLSCWIIAADVAESAVVTATYNVLSPNGTTASETLTINAATVAVPASSLTTTVVTVGDEVSKS